MSIAWMKDLGEVLMDDTHIVLTRKQYEALSGYESIGQPTSPSIGRVYRTNNQGHRKPVPVGLVVTVEPDPEGREGWVLRRGRVPLFLDEPALEPDPEPEPDPTHCACGRPLDAVGEHGGGYGAFCG